MIELTPQAKEIFAEYSALKDLWQDNLEPAPIQSRTPHEFCYYQGSDLFLPIDRFIDGELVEHREFEDENYSLVGVADDVLVLLSVGGQNIIDRTNEVELPRFGMKRYEERMSDIRSQLEKLMAIA
jgi:hypothetical protein